MTARWGEPVRRAHVSTDPSPVPAVPEADLSLLLDRRATRPPPDVPDDRAAALAETEESQ